MDATRAYQKAVRIRSSIYYIGGIMPLSVSQFLEAPMNSVVIYDTDIGQWRTQSTNGPEPTTRIRHSATLCMFFFLYALNFQIRKKVANYFITA